MDHVVTTRFDSCMACPTGTYATFSGATSCLKCDAGFYLLLGTSCAPCPVGTYAPAGSVACTVCALGSYSPNSINCIPCQVGTYGPTAGLSACAHCSPGWYLIASNNQCLRCMPGTYSQTGILTACTICANGAYGNVQEASVCGVCVAGTYSIATASTACSKCGVGKYNMLDGLSMCVQCSSGTYNAANGSSMCGECTAGWFAGSGATVCIQCGMGVYADASKASACKQCMNGTYNDRMGASVCGVCGAGTYAVGAVSACTVCSAGTYQVGSRGTGCQACAGCSDGQWAIGMCTPTSPTQCAPCSVCKEGDYLVGSCNAGDYMGYASQDVVCQKCPTCRNGTYLSAGCVNNAAPVCSICSNCTGDTVLACTSMSDTVCSDVVSCRRNVNYTVYEWITEAERCKLGQYLVGIVGGNPVCKQCPVGLYGPNGLWCEACYGYKHAYLDATACVCEQGTQISYNGNCVCGVGREFMESGCVLCGINTYSNYSLELGDSWFSQYKPCDICDAGKYSMNGMTACLDCAFGMYREVDMDACEVCEAGYFAMDPAVGNCTECNSTCEVGFNPVSCPTDVDLFICEPCDNPPLNAVLTPAVNFTSNTACDWECLDGYFRFNETYCQACSSLICEPGYKFTNCSRISDSNCDLECVDKNKPLFNSKWTVGCEWGCVDGYSLSVQDYVLFVQYSCVLGGARSFWSWG